MKLISVILLLFFSAKIFADQFKEQQLYPCSINNAAQKIKVNKGTLLICYFGSTPKPKKDEWISVTGASFYRVIPGDKTNPEFLAQSDESGFGIDYRIEDNILEIITYFDTYPNFDTKPFYQERIKLDRIPATYETYLIYKPTSITKNEAAKAVNLLKIDEKTYRKLYQSQWPDWIYRKLFVVRDYAFIDPIWASSELDKMDDYWWNDGEVSEVVESIKNDIIKIAQMKSSHP